MAYTPYYSGGWQNNEEGGTPINAAALNHMESGISTAVERTGDTMTGNLVIQGDIYPSVVLKPTRSDNTMVGIVEGSYTGTAALSIYEDSSGTNRRMIQVQSASAASSLDNAIMLRDGVNGTITNYRVFHAGMATPVPVANGGTGAADAAGARAAINAVNKAGDTMTGRLVVPEFRVNNPTGTPSVVLMNNGQALISIGVHSSKRGIFAQYGNNTSHYEVFMLPATNDDLTSNPYYSLLSDKNAVTVAQGGTGANNASDALKNLNVRAGTATIESVAANSQASVFVNFETPMPIDTYTVTCTKNGAVTPEISWSVASRATNRFAIIVYNSGNAALTNITMFWQAIAM